MARRRNNPAAAGCVVTLLIIAGVGALVSAIAGIVGAHPVVSTIVIVVVVAVVVFGMVQWRRARQREEQEAWQLNVARSQAAARTRCRRGSPNGLFLCWSAWQRRDMKPTFTGASGRS
ncbi:hypothetical protein QRX50_35350 [Amycolatopsis carbonis]|uniref:Uncharacterized protein n=1 Tax=Amycolatopsis carbonis TaxID=715471 RepID=A0A9Y2IB73_9PSEU|nr:hypothetical protein [Amycolatopsis sp. 2-15]WIX76694.1 hypothetical protein QRX50_35350 [Amycolatopsis sp. 2-15]